MTTPKAKLAGLALIAALCAGFTLVLPSAHALASDLIWSQDPSAYERHLQRRHDNPLFPSHRRFMTQDEVDQARQKDLEDIKSAKVVFTSILN